MSMNIGSMLRALMGELQVEGVKAMELRVGQIVRGVLLEMLDNHEALMNINGVQVRAKLETALPVGTGTLLQVQPGSNAGSITLKPLAETGDFPADEGLKDVLKSFGLPDQKWSLDLMRGLKRDGYPIGKDTAAYFQAAAALKPAGTNMQSWMSAADVAFRRGLTVSQDTLGSLRQALYGPPIHEQMASLAEALQQWQHTGGQSPIAQGLAGRLQALLAQGEALLAQGEAQLLAGTGQSETAGKPGDLWRQQSAGTQPGETRLAEAKSATSAVRADLGISPPLPSVTSEVNDSGKAGVVDARTIAAEAKAAPHSAQGSGQGNKADGQASAANPAPDLVSASGREPAAAPQLSIPRGEAAWIGRFLNWLGAGHENALLRTSADMRMRAEQAMPLVGTFAAEAADGTFSESPRTVADSFKSALLSLAAHDETPPVLREAAQSLVSQITGQQLLLSSDRQPTAPYSLMTLFVPMKGQGGDTTAAVHVQTRRSRRGEWDTDNCRLLFDLRMRHLGDTVVDVQVVDRIVSLKLMNDYPGMAALVDQAREQLSSGLQTAGFQLLSVTAAPLPSYKEPSAVENGEKTDKTDSAKSSAYAAKKYKGVDFRV